jgi:hypothetical protein
MDWIVTGPITAIWLGLIAGANSTDIAGAVSGIGKTFSPKPQPRAGTLARVSVKEHPTNSIIRVALLS